jgi:hypothetical protein
LPRDRAEGFAYPSGTQRECPEIVNINHTLPRVVLTRMRLLLTRELPVPHCG